MQKIRIGNDIRLTIQLRLPDGNLANIKSAKALFINSTLQDRLETEYRKKNRFIGRFPIEPFVNEFEPTPYNINSCGYPKYNVTVRNYYKGFGINPDWNKCLPLGKVNVTEYVSDIQHEESPSTVTVNFPAEAQLYPGIYKLVVIAQIYAPGYKNNIRTITTEYRNLFELCKEEGEMHSVTLTIGQNDLVNPDGPIGNDVYVVSGTYEGDKLILHRSNDADDVEIDLYDWYTDNN